MAEFNALKSELLRLDREKHHLDYLTTCKEIGLIPKFLAVKSNFVSTNFAKQKYNLENVCLKAVIRRKHALVNTISKRIYGYKNSGLYDSYSQFATGGVFDHSMRVIQQYRFKQQLELDAKLVKKIQCLSGNLKSFNRKDVPVAFVNLSSHEFNERETRLLNKGPKYIADLKIKPADYIPQLEDMVKNVPQNKKEELRYNLFSAYSQHLKRTSRKSFYEDSLIRSIKKTPGLVFLSTDKSNRIAILDKQDYLNKMEVTIKDIKCNSIVNDPLASMTYKTSQVVKAFKSKEWPEAVRKLAKLNPLGVIPKLFGVLKDHKVNNPIRPIVTRCAAPTYFLEKALVIILRDLLPPSDHVLSSTTQFVNKIQQLRLPPDYFMFSLDVVSLFPSINMSKARDNIAGIIGSNPSVSSNMKEAIVRAINLIINSNYFVFNKVIYEQMSGTPMGSPISGIIAEFILRPLEHTFLTSITNKPTCWYRYVDDVFGIWEGTPESFTDFVDNLNQQDHHIQFTCEKEVNNKLPYLDVMLTRDATGIQRSVYRKPHNTLCTIPSDASAPKLYKQAAYRSYVKRAMSICTPGNIHEELNLIRKIAIDNGYSVGFINNIICDINRQRQHPPSLNTVKRYPLQYISGLHEKIARIMKPYGFQVIAHTHRKLKDILKSNLDVLPDMSRPGVYEIPLIRPNNQVIHYIGQTSRKLKVRVQEHKNDLKQGKLTSALFKVNLDEPGIRVMFDDARIIAPFTTVQRTILRESLEIKSRGSAACNEQDSCTIPGIWFSIL